MGRSADNRGDYNGKRDEYGREMTELVTVELERGEWWLVRNQLRNMADEWRRFNKQSPLAQRCENIADEIDRQWYRDGTDTDVQDVTGQSGT